MDSISYITQKHCRNGLNYLCAVLLLAIGVVAFEGITGYAGTVFGLICAMLAVFVYLYTRGSAKSCTMLQIPLIVLSVAAFFVGIIMSTLGFTLFHYQSMHDYLQGRLAQYGYVLALPPQTAAVLLCAGALILFILSFYAFCAIKYLNTVKSCLNNIISRHGARIFSVASILVFVITAAAAAAFLFSCGGLAALMADRAAFSLFAELVLLALLLLFTGISVSSFITATYAFKVFEEKMMKVETNADGTVYVPVKEEYGREPRPIPIPITKPPKPAGKSNSSGKQFIKNVGELDASDVIDGSHSEYDIM